MKATLTIILLTCFWSCTNTSRTTNVDTATLKYELVGTLQDGYAVEYTDPLGNTVNTGPAAVPGGWTKTFSIEKNGKCYSIKAGGALQGGNTTVNIYINDALVATKQCNCSLANATAASTCY
jgi:hypothetical protein